MCEDYISLTPASYLMADVTCNTEPVNRTQNKFSQLGGGWFIKRK